MGETKIEWADYTFNPWWGCVEVSPACDNCYARTFAKRVGQNVWGKDESRRHFGPKYWNNPVLWNAKAEAEGVRRRVFCGSMMDVMEDRADLQPSRAALYDLIERTTRLDWMLLTKRPQNFRKFLPQAWLDNPRSNVWLMTTVELPEYLWRVAYLLEVPAVVHGLSIEPLLGNIDLTKIPNKHPLGENWFNAFDGRHYDDGGKMCGFHCGGGVSWVIVGGESGPGARPSHPDWFRQVRNQCIASDTAFLFKQWGDWKPISEMAEAEHNGLYRSRVKVAALIQRNPDMFITDDAETQSRLDDIHGRDCTVQASVIRHDGEVFEIVQPGAFELRDGKQAYLTFRVGKKAAGRLLDGRTWDEFPEVRV